MEELLIEVLAARDHFEVLGFQKYRINAATPAKDELRKAYIKRSLICHPDKCQDPRGTEAFQRLALAYETLSDDVKRRDYIYSLGSKDAKPQQSSSSWSSSPPFNHQDPAKQTYSFAENINLAEALGLFATVVNQFSDLGGPNASFFHQAANAVAMVDVYMKRKRELEAAQEGRSAAEQQRREEVDDAHPLSLKNIQTGLRLAGAAATAIGIFSSMMSKKSEEEEEKQKRERRTS